MPSGDAKFTQDAEFKPLTGTEYFKRCIGNGYTPSVLNKHHASHPATIRRVFDEARTRHPEAADVIASLVFFNAIDRNREEFMQENGFRWQRDDEADNAK